MKSVSLISKRDDLTSKEFRDYYESTHCFKAMTWFPFRGYCRNYVLSASDDLGFDCINEVEVDLGSIAPNVMNSGSRAMLKEDEQQFMKPDLIRFAKVDERILFGDSGKVLPRNCQRFVFLFRRGEQTPAEFEQEMEVTAQDVVRTSTRLLQCSLDIVSPATGDTFPFDALLWLSVQNGGNVPEPDTLPGLASAISVDTHRTDESVLTELFEGYRP